MISSSFEVSVSRQLADSPVLPCQRKKSVGKAPSAGHMLKALDKRCFHLNNKKTHTLCAVSPQNLTESMLKVIAAKDRLRTQNPTFCSMSRVRCGVTRVCKNETSAALMLCDSCSTVAVLMTLSSSRSDNSASSQPCEPLQTLPCALMC